MAKRKTKGITKIPFILALIAGIYELLGGLFYVLFGKVSDFGGLLVISEISTVIGVLLLAFGIAFILGSVWMKKGERKGAITTLVVSIIALITLQIIPGVLGLISAIIALKKK